MNTEEEIRKEVNNININIRADTSLANKPSESPVVQ